MTDHPDPASAQGTALDEAHAFALLIWAQQEAMEAGEELLLPYSAAVTRRHTDALALERANLLGRRTDVPQEEH